MNIKYFSDTDTLHVEFNNHPIAETRDLDDNTVMDVDAEGHLVALAIEHAKQTAALPAFSFQQV